jgi:hypothetical protein
MNMMVMSPLSLPLKRNSNSRHFGTMLALVICIVAFGSNRGPMPLASAFASRNTTPVRMHTVLRRSGTGAPPLFSTNPPAGPGTDENAAIPAGDGGPSASLLDRFRRVSNVASLLCVLDCTLLPLVTVALPLLGVLDLGAARVRALDRLGHALALYFVLPVGGFPTVVNYLSHRRARIAALAILGLALVGTANSHFHVPWGWPWGWLGTILHKAQGCGTSPWHRVANVGGCALLLGANYWSQRQDGCAAHGIAGDVCGQDHGCDHGKGCND